MSTKKSLVLLLLLIFFLNKSGIAQATIIPDLSDNYVEKLIDVAKQNYPRIKTFQNRVNIASSNVTKTRVSYLEALTLSYVYQPGTTTIDPVNPTTSYFKGFQAGVFLNLGTILEKPFLIRQAKQDLIIAHNDQDEYMITLATEVKKRYYMYIERVAELKLQIKTTQDIESSLKDIKYRFEKGEETFDSYNKIQILYTDRQQLKILAESNIFMAKADLEELLGTKLENVK
ncbi:MAG: TolC family protein [Mucilaginibacter sp.]